MKDNFVIRLLLIVLAALILIALVAQYNKTSAPSANIVKKEAFHAEPRRPAMYRPPHPFPRARHPVVAEEEAPLSALDNVNTGVQPSEPSGNEEYRPVDFPVDSVNQEGGDCFPKDRLTAEDLLPKDAANSQWAQVNPAGQGDVKDQNFLTAGFHIGINTVGQTLRNANLQIRSEPANPKMQVSPWNQSTIDYDTSRRNFELGEC